MTMLIRVFIGVLLSVQSWALTKEVQILVNMETKSNAAASRSNTPIAIKHYEIPLRLLESDIADRLEENIRESLLFTKNGETYVRWIINPEDTRHYKVLKHWMQKKGINTTQHEYFTAYQTASRSYIIEDPRTGAQFSAKVSTNVTGGNWRDKKQEWDDAEFIRKDADFVARQASRTPFEHVVVMDEPAAFGVKAINQGFLIRTFPDLNKGQVYYVPGFSVMHTTRGRNIALINGSNDPERFWNEHYNKPLARAIAEFLHKTGQTYDSPHSQNFLVELDKNYRPTGRIVFRDFGDDYINEKYFNTLDRKDIVELQPKENLLKKNYVSMGIMHGNTKPEWLSEQQYSRWGKEFYQEFDKEYSRQTGLPRKTFSELDHSQNGDYFSKTIYTKDDIWNGYFDRLANTYGSLHRGTFKCQSMFAQ